MNMCFGRTGFLFRVQASDLPPAGRAALEARISPFFICRRVHLAALWHLRKPRSSNPRPYLRAHGAACSEAPHGLYGRQPSHPQTRVGVGWPRGPSCSCVELGEESGC